MFYIYVLKSDASNRIYIGSTANINTRVMQHNQGKTPSTKPYKPWRLIYSESFQTKRESLIRERQMKKSGVIRNALREEKYNGLIV
ncbi:endonuclease [Candidatus Uhrbacteria bacterium CG_4_9_14_3_um_filter_41_35]|uniref:Endonuclease n=1 Tax=Candidatus Uhrbacteria bacterium CG_4_9_14_3_um_filter_41_35 TaxID=1975034 RepID=A0A2M7XEL7_9BACT|nr:MAG: endonuclease [Candidatus Uhrbacteria bacterium CG11_big_fil_rev_8_21_14_0_20_41_9]PJA46311.1 MAG: endonuclease [Candidatus Uhrbacteria bacterium CG_4_9_14_3_um_filter_41_35]